MHQLLPLLISILLLVIFLLLKFDLGWALFISSVVLTTVSGLGLMEIPHLFKNTLTDSFFLEIVGIILLINLLEELLRERGYFNQALQALQEVFTNRIMITAIFPALLGSIPAFGGARLSAPMVDMAGKGLDLNRIEKANLNYWFRHIWEYGSPLFPGVILAIYLSGVEMWRYIMMMLPFSAISIILGYLFFLRPVLKKNQHKQGGEEIIDNRGSAARLGWIESAPKLFSILWPVFVIILTVLVFKLSILWPLLVSNLVLLWQRIKNAGVGKGLWQNLLLRKDSVKKIFSFKLLWMVLGVFLFKTTFEQTGLPQIIPSLLTAAGIPSFVLIIIFPFLIGLLTGLMSAFVGITYPLLVPLFYQGGTIHLGAVALAFIAGHMGTMLSPLHFCFILTVEYFQAELRPFWIKLFYPELIMLLSALAWSAVLGLPS